MQKKLLFITSFLTLFFTFALAFDLSPFLRGPAPYPPQWRWDYNFVNTFPRIWLPLLVAFTISWLFAQVIKEKDPEKREKIILFQFVAYSFLLQLSVLFFQRSGIGVLLHRIIDPGLNGYFSTGIGISNVQDFLKNYNRNVLSFYQHAQGHPPGAVLIFYFLKQFFSHISLSIPFIPKGDVGTLWKSLSNSEQLTALFSAFFIPFLSSLTIIPLYKLTKLLYGIKPAFISILLYIGVPSIILFTPLNDVFLPLFTVWSLYFLVKGVSESSKLNLFFSGFIFSIGLLFSITFLPLLLVFALYFLLKKKTKMALGMELNFGVGLLLIPALLYMFFSLNFIELVTVLKSGLPELRSYKVWLFYNVYDFFVFCSIPLLVLFFSNINKQVTFFRKKLFKKIDVLFISFIFMLFILDLSGSVRGETGRIWLPFVPLVIIPAAHFLTEQKFSNKQILVIFFLQIVQLLVMAEFWVTLY